jgi:AMMECR1 domain-containing protein
VWIGISVLTPMSPVKDWREIVVGRDGVQLRREPYRSVFLPQVATEQGWDRGRLLSQLALKAGLASDGWTSADLFTFQAESFAEPARASHSPGGG